MVVLSIIMNVDGQPIMLYVSSVFLLDLNDSYGGVYFIK